MLGEEILIQIEAVKEFREQSDQIAKVLVYAQKIAASRLEAYILLIKGLELSDEEADNITKNHAFWQEVDLTDEFEEVCYYDEILNIFSE